MQAQPVRKLPVGGRVRHFTVRYGCQLHWLAVKETIVVLCQVLAVLPPPRSASAVFMPFCARAKIR